MGAHDVARILVPVDFSEGSRTALEAALFIARGFGARVDLLHVWEPPAYIPIDTALATVGTGPPRTLAAIARAEAGREMAELVAGLQQRGELATRSRIEAGNPADVIVTLVAEAPYDLIVMGTHGRRGFRRLLMGSVAEQVLRRASCPVLTLRTAGQEE